MITYTQINGIIALIWLAYGIVLLRQLFAMREDYTGAAYQRNAVLSAGAVCALVIALVFMQTCAALGLVIPGTPK